MTSRARSLTSSAYADLYSDPYFFIVFTFHSAFQPTPALSIASSSTSPTLPSPSLAPDRDDRLDEDSIDIDVNSPDFVSRVSHLPIVNSALRAYEQSKASSRVVKVCVYFIASLSCWGVRCESLGTKRRAKGEVMCAGRYAVVHRALDVGHGIEARRHLVHI